MSQTIDKSKSIHPLLFQRTSRRLTALRLWLFKRWLGLGDYAASVVIAYNRKEIALARPLRLNRVLA
jgi:hypothetical protein